MFPTSSASSRSRRATAFAVVAAFSFVALAPAIDAETAPPGPWASLANYLDMNGLTWSDVPERVPVTRVDLATGAESVEEMPLADAFALFPEGGPVDPQPMAGDAHVVTGYVFHNCSDPIRECYFWDEQLEGTGDEAEAAVGGVNDEYSGATGDDLPVPRTYRAVNAEYEDTTGNDLPVPGNEVLRVKGKYWGGFHRVGAFNFAEGPGLEDGLPGGGPFNPHFDRSMAGYGSGWIFMITIPWGHDLVISYGWMEATGQFVFCKKETTYECAQLAGAYDQVTAAKKLADLEE